MICCTRSILYNSAVGKVVSQQPLLCRCGQQLIYTQNYHVMAVCLVYPDSCNKCSEDLNRVLLKLINNVLIDEL